MRIENSNLSLAAESSCIEKYTSDETLKSWVGNTRPDFEGKNIQNPQQEKVRILVPEDILEISDRGLQELAKQAKLSSTGVVEDEDGILFEMSERDKQKLLMIQRMIEALTGKKLKFVIPDKIKLDRPSGKLEAIQLQSPVRLQQRAGWGVEYDLHEAYYEKQDLAFSAQGTVKTADGREIKFDVGLELSREYMSRTDVSLRMGDAVKVDPLVINFDNPSARLTESKVAFDLNMDGTAEQISFTANGNGFLAMDGNNDGRINDGSELFGPQSGNGFADLSKYDGDGNGWIDENDDIYDKLRIWTKDEQGNDQLLALGKKGIGAIYLGSAAATYNLKDMQNQTLGSIGSTGIFLRENGTVGTIQHVDIAI